MEIQEIIKQYKGGRKLPEIDKFNKEYDVKKHAIFTDQLRFPDRTVITDYIDENGVKQNKTETVKLNRIGLAYQKKIVSIATTFFCGTPIKYTNNIEDASMYDAFQKAMQKNKTEFVDREILDAIGRFTEVAELWYHTEEPNDALGFKTGFRLRVKVLTPDTNKLYPIFDENDNLTSFSREFKINRDKKDVEVFEVYTDTQIMRFEKEKKWAQVESKPNPIGKIPIVFRQQDDVEWADVQTAIERLEQIYSNSAESNDRFAFPILKLRGKVTGQMSRDRSGRVLQFEGEDSDADFANAPHAPQSLNDEIERLERDTHDFTSTPNISFDNMRGLGNMLAGSSAEFLFLSAHLKVMDKLSIHIPAFQRRASVVKSYLQMMNSQFRNKELDVDVVVTPFVINNDADFMEFLMKVNGGKPLYSQEYSMQKAGIKNPEEMMAQISSQKESV